MNESHTPLGDIGSMAKENYLNNQDDSDRDEFDLFFREFLNNAAEIDWKNLGIDVHDVFAVSRGSGKSQHGYGFGQRHDGAGANWDGVGDGQTSGTASIGGDSSLSELGGSITHGAASISGTASGSDSWSELIRNDPFLSRLRALLKAKMMTSGEWQKWISSGGTASSKGFLGRGQPSHILQVIKGKIGKNNIGGSARTVLGGSNWYEMKTNVTRNQTSHKSPIPIVRSQINNI